MANISSYFDRNPPDWVMAPLAARRDALAQEAKGGPADVQYDIFNLNEQPQVSQAYSDFVQETAESLAPNINFDANGLPEPIGVQLSNEVNQRLRGMISERQTEIESFGGITGTAIEEDRLNRKLRFNFGDGGAAPMGEDLFSRFEALGTAIDDIKQWREIDIPDWDKTGQYARELAIGVRGATAGGSAVNLTSSFDPDRAEEWFGKYFSESWYKQGGLFPSIEPVAAPEPTEEPSFIDLKTTELMRQGILSRRRAGYMQSMNANRGLL